MSLNTIDYITDTNDPPMFLTCGRGLNQDHWRILLLWRVRRATFEHPFSSPLTPQRSSHARPLRKSSVIQIQTH